MPRRKRSYSKRRMKSSTRRRRSRSKSKPKRRNTKRVRSKAANAARRTNSVYAKPPKMTRGRKNIGTNRVRTVSTPKKRRMFFGRKPMNQYSSTIQRNRVLPGPEAVMQLENFLFAPQNLRSGRFTGRVSKLHYQPVHPIAKKNSLKKPLSFGNSFGAQEIGTQEIGTSLSPPRRRRGRRRVPLRRLRAAETRAATAARSAAGFELRVNQLIDELADCEARRMAAEGEIDLLVTRLEAPGTKPPPPPVPPRSGMPLVSSFSTPSLSFESFRSEQEPGLITRVTRAMTPKRLRRTKSLPRARRKRKK